MKTTLIWFLITVVPILGSLIDYHKNERPKRKHKISHEINTNDTLNIKNSGEDRTNR
tara:strand:+ start:801 stop:971 length:171 start_codon:yes stop_codon:yes gene_type:complete